jgi:hypothetical protein
LLVRLASCRRHQRHG